MTVGIKTKEDDVILFDAVTNRSESYGASLTKHPLETGAVITDHSVISNPTFSIDGVISSVDFGGIVIDIVSEGERFDTTSLYILDKPDNLADPVSILAGGGSPFSSLIPEGLASLVPIEDKPIVIAQESKRVDLGAVKQDIIGLQREAELVDILILDGNILKEVIKNCIITSINFSETPDTGDALDVSLSLEQVQFATLSKSVVPSLTWKELQVATSDESRKGKQGGKKGDASNPNDPVAKKAPPAVTGMAKCDDTHVVCWLQELGTADFNLN